MVGMGTIINGAAIVVAGLIGMVGGNFLKESMQETLQRTTGVATLMIGIAGTMEKMLSVDNTTLVSGQSMLITICLALGAFVGELLQIEDAFERFGEWLKKKTGNAKDSGFVDGFVTTSITVSIGAMAIVGALQDGIYGDYSILAAKSVLDFIIVMVMTCSLGKGCIFSAIPVVAFEGLFTLLAVFIKPIMTTLALDYISLIGSILIFCVGINLVFGKRIRVANLLPALLFAIAAAFLPIG